MAKDMTTLLLNKIEALVDELRKEMHQNNKKIIDALVGQGILDLEEEMWSIEDTATKLKLSRRTIIRMIEDGRLPATKMGNAKNSPVRIRPADARQAKADMRNKTA